MKIGDLVINTSRPGRGPGLIIKTGPMIGLDRFSAPTSFCVIHSGGSSQNWYNKYQLKIISSA